MRRGQALGIKSPHPPPARPQSGMLLVPLLRGRDLSVSGFVNQGSGFGNQGCQLQDGVFL